MEDSIFGSEIEMLTIRDLSKFLRLTEQSIYRLTREGKIPYYKVGGSIRFRKSEIDAYLREHYMKDVPVQEHHGSGALQEGKPTKPKRSKNRGRNEVHK